MSLQEHVLPGETEPRKLGRTEPSSEALTLRAGMMSYAEYLDANKLARLPQDKWRPIDRRTLFDDSWVNDQQRYGACVGASDVMAHAKLRVLRGLDRVDLSWAYVYDQINGGRDNGACITDAAKVSVAGTPLYSDYAPVPQFNMRSQPDSRLLYRLGDYLVWGDWLDGCDIVQRGGIVQYPVQVGNNYSHLDSNGCCGVDRGPGNHSVHSDGMVFLSALNEWVWTHMGSWTVNWGNHGRAFHREAHIRGCAVENDAFGHLWVLDPNG
jgi:hypothetical protein